MKFKICLLFTFLAFTLIACNDTNDAELKLSNKVDSLQVQNDSLMEILANERMDREVSGVPQWYYSETDSKNLIDRGIEDPAAFIKSALREKLDLIPIKAVLGGTMHYNNIQLLGDQWLIADFEDGHVYGKAIFQYTIGKNDKLEFKIIAFADN